MSSLVTSLGYNFVGQLFGRLISFVINVYLLRVIDNDVLGLVNVRLTLMYNTILFLTREPMRKANIHRDSLPQFVNIVWMSPLICFVLSLICIVVWELFSSSSKDLPLFVLLAFPLSAFIESLAEPFAVFSLRFSLSAHFAWSQSLLVCLQRVFVVLLLFTSINDHLFICAVSQVLASLVYLLFHLIRFRSFSSRRLSELAQFEGFSSFFPQPQHGLNKDSVRALSTMLGHSVLKQLVTDGSGYVMTFTDVLSLKNQAVYDAIERLGSLVCRIVLAPLEENCAAHFRNEINSQSQVFDKNSDRHDSLVRTFTDILHISCILGMIVCAFGAPYSKLAVWVYGGSLLYDNGGALLLSLYSVYVFVMAINGITEGFAMSSMNNRQVAAHGLFLSVLAVVQLLLNLVLVYYYNAAGFVIAKCIDMLARIVYSWGHIGEYLGTRTPSVLAILPSFSTFIFLLFALVATSFSQLLFGSTPGLSHSLSHVAIGAVLLVLLVVHIVQHDIVVQRIVHGATRIHSD